MVSSIKQLVILYYQTILGARKKCLVDPEKVWRALLSLLYNLPIFETNLSIELISNGSEYTSIVVVLAILTLLRNNFNLEIIH